MTIVIKSKGTAEGLYNLMREKISTGQVENWQMQGHTFAPTGEWIGSGSFIGTWDSENVFYLTWTTFDVVIGEDLPRDNAHEVMLATLDKYFKPEIFSGRRVEHALGLSLPDATPAAETR